MDETDSSYAAALSGIRFARRSRMEVVGLFIAPYLRRSKFKSLIFGKHIAEERHARSMSQIAEVRLAQLSIVAEGMGVRFFSAFSMADDISVEMGIAARKFHCDLIILCSDKEYPANNRVLDRIRKKLLASYAIPVLVYSRTENSSVRVRNDRSSGIRPFQFKT